MSIKTDRIIECTENPHKVFRKLKYGVIAFLTVVAYQIIVILCVPIYIFRLVVPYLAKWLRPDLGSCLDAMSSYFASDLLRNGKSPRCTTVLPITLEGNLTKDELIRAVQKNWVDAVENDTGQPKYPQFKNYLCWWLGFPFWKTDSSFDVRNHVFSYTEEIGQQSSHVVTDKKLDRYVEKLLNAPYQNEKSPWELHVVENYQSDKFPSATTSELSVMVMRLHHCLGDGFSLLDVLVAGLIESNINELELPKIRYPKYTFWQRLTYYITFPIKYAYEFALIFSNVFKDCPWKVPDSIKTWHQRYVKSEFIAVEKVKHIKNVLGVSFTSVLLSSISAGICKSLEEKRRNRSLRVEKLDDYMISLSALPLPETEATKKIRFKNHVTAIVFTIPVNRFPSPIERLRKCDRILEESKNSVVPMATIIFVKTIGWLTGNLCYMFGKNRMVSTGLTNFPTLQKPGRYGTICGKKVLFAEFFSGAHNGNAGAGFMAISFYPYIRIAATAESALLSRDELTNLIKYIEEELEVLYSIATAIDPSRSPAMSRITV